MYLIHDYSGNRDAYPIGNDADITGAVSKALKDHSIILDKDDLLLVSSDPGKASVIAPEIVMVHISEWDCPECCAHNRDEHSWPQAGESLICDGCGFQFEVKKTPE